MTNRFFMRSLCAALLFGLLFAAGPVSAASGGVDISSRETEDAVVISVTLAPEADIRTFSACLFYDQTYLRAKAQERGPAGQDSSCLSSITSIDSLGWQMDFSAGQEQDLSAGGTLFNFRFEILKPLDEPVIGLAVTKALDADGNESAVSMTGNADYLVRLDSDASSLYSGNRYALSASEEDLNISNVTAYEEYEAEASLSRDARLAEIAAEQADAYAQAEAEGIAKSMQDPIFWILLTGAALIIVLIAAYFMRRRRRPKMQRDASGQFDQYFEEKVRGGK